MRMPNDAQYQQPAPEWAAMRRALADAAPPAQVEAALMQALARGRAPRRMWMAPRGWLGFGALALVAVVLAAGVRVPAGVSPEPAAMAFADPGFVALSGLTAAQLAAAQPQLMRTELPRSTLVAMGIPLADNAPHELIRTELLVAASGEPLAVRLSLN